MPPQPAAAIGSLTRKGLRGYLEVSGSAAGATAPRPVEAGGARLLVEDDELEGAAVLAALIGPEGRVITQRRTRVGGDNA